MKEQIIEQLLSISNQVRSVRKLIDLLEVKPSTKSSMITMCQGMLDEAYSLTLELGRVKCIESCTQETSTIQEG